MRLLRWLQQVFCEHECYVHDIRRMSPEEVICPCRKCGKVLHAPYGLALKAKLVSTYSNRGAC